MNKTLFVTVLGLVLFVPGVSHAAFNFGSVSSDQIYLEQDQNAIVVKEIRTSAAYDFSPPAGVTCESEAQQAGLPESNNYWCLQRPVLGSIGYGTCVFLCQVGVGSGSNSGASTPGRMITYILSSAPVGHPLSYFNNASQSEQNAMYDSMMCMGFPSFGVGCELKKHNPIPTASLSANPSSIVSGSSSALTWSSTNTTSCSLNQSIGGVATTGTRSVSPSTTTTYTVTCTGAGGTANASATVTVTAGNTPTAILTANPTSVVSGSASTLTWSSTDATSCTGTGFSAGGTTSGSVSTGALSSTTNYSVSCTGTGGTGTDSETVTVTSAPQPDLTAGGVSPSSATEDSSVTLSSTVANSGSALAGAFPNIFQIENGAIITANTVSSLATGASASLSASYTFTSAGTYRVRACVDNNSSWAGSVTESNEGNNCGEYTTITVNACSGVGCTGYTGTLSCVVNNGSPLVGQTVTYTATPGAGATGPYIWTASDGVTGLGTSATASRTFPSPGTYTMNVSSATGANASCSPQVSVGCGVAAASISASPTRVTKGSTATLTVPSLSGVDGTCTVTGPGVSRTLTASGCAVPATSFPTAAINTLSTYTISCDGGETTAKVIVNVVPAFQEF